MGRNNFLCRVTALTIFLLLFGASLQAQSKELEVLELRNYLIKPEQRDNYINFFESEFKDTLNAKGNYILGQYRVKNAPDNFLWIRGFENMQAREEGYKAFYASKQWKDNSDVALEYILNYDNVYLLQPIKILEGEAEANKLYDSEWFGKPKGVTVIDFYIARGKRDQFVEFLNSTYKPVLNTIGINDISYWISLENPDETCVNEDLIVAISFFRNESEYNKK